tara:strand:+ start:1367 stop:2305 length:939 start_codon:yes stop_codon:yes gene_type:complete
MSQLTARFQNIYQIDKVHFKVVGCGAIGSFTAMALARSGAKYVSLYDHDVVSTVNIGVQHFNMNHIGKSKVNMLARQMHEINPTIKIGRHPKKFEPGMTWSHNRIWISDDVDCEIFIIGVDSMKARSLVTQHYFQRLKEQTTSRIYGKWNSPNSVQNSWLIDARMGSETFQSNVFKHDFEEVTPLYDMHPFNDICNNMEDYWGLDWRDQNMLDATHGSDSISKAKQDYKNAITEQIKSYKNEYNSTWYSDEEGDSEPCNARSTGYCASMAGAFINNQIRKIVDRNSLVNPEITFNFPSMMLTSTMDKSRLTI